MKQQIAKMIGVFGLLLMAACANAQTLNVKAKVPFDFVVGGKALPAGDYSIQSIPTGNSHALVIRKENAGGGMVLLGNSAQSASPSLDTRLVFHRYGETYFLSQIWTAGNSSGREFQVTGREVEMASNTERSADVIVLASLR